MASYDRMLCSEVMKKMLHEHSFNSSGASLTASSCRHPQDRIGRVVNPEDRVRLLQTSHGR